MDKKLKQVVKDEIKMEAPKGKNFILKLASEIYDKTIGLMINFFK